MAVKTTTLKKQNAPLKQYNDFQTRSVQQRAMPTKSFWNKTGICAVSPTSTLGLNGYLAPHAGSVWTQHRIYAVWVPTTLRLMFSSFNAARLRHHMADRCSVRESWLSVMVGIGLGLVVQRMLGMSSTLAYVRNDIILTPMRPLGSRCPRMRSEPSNYCLHVSVLAMALLESGVGRIQLETLPRDDVVHGKDMPLMLLTTILLPPISCSAEDNVVGVDVFVK